jgi:hypothetical protein
VRARDIIGLESNRRLQVRWGCTLDLHVGVDTAATDAEGKSGRNLLGFGVGKSAWRVQGGRGEAEVEEGAAAAAASVVVAVVVVVGVGGGGGVLEAGENEAEAERRDVKDHTVP